MSRREPAKEPAPEPNGNQIKFAWIYYLSADTTLSPTAKLVATLTALKLAGRKGHFKATHKAIGALCGMKYMTVRRAVDELCRENYLDRDVTDTTPGGANVYTIIPPDERVELWKVAVRQYEEKCRDWDYAKQRWEWDVEHWLDAENKHYAEEWLAAERDAHDKYTTTVFKAVYERCANSAFAKDVAEIAWESHQEGELTLADALEKVASVPQDQLPESDPEFLRYQSAEMSSPLLTREQTPAHQRADPCSPVSRPLLNSDAPTSANDHSHKSFKSVKTLKNIKGRAAHPPASGRCARPTEECGLCNGTGTFMDADGYPVQLLNEDCEAREVDCLHSMAENLAEIRRIESESNGYWGLGKTGYREIDSLYGFEEYNL